MLRQHLKETETDSIPPHSGRARRIIRAAALEIRLARCRGVIAEIGVVLRARLLAQEPRLHTPVTLNRRPRLVERLGIFTRMRTSIMLPPSINFQRSMT